jgi:hypothetical protein
MHPVKQSPANADARRNHVSTAVQVLRPDVSTCFPSDENEANRTLGSV